MQGNQTPILKDFELHTLGMSGIPFLDFLVEPRDITITPSSISDDVVSLLIMLADNGVVDYSALFVEKDGERGAEMAEG